ncbi:DUF6516 family protein [Caenimonas koreensis]|uniref:Uncharacterized protein n=1 Tax=Caenimonas koreensis DSM 17982 TaxID=1121255 RepID=A0A844B2Z6_9BURK|nr:DUF6516 family protein [Caenimonas koreensis]MRD47622.1 hypothetical protein [Caenimonas koreensis DSM 17982]
MTARDQGIETLLDLDASLLEQEAGYWIKIEARRVAPTDFIPHGIRYTLTLHNQHGTRVLGYDNAHAVKPPGKFKFAGRRLPYDHKHRTASDKGVPYTFDSAQKLLEDFFAEVDRVITAASQGGSK